MGPYTRMESYALEITKQRADKEKTIQHRNAQRAAEKGIPEPVQKY